MEESFDAATWRRTKPLRPGHDGNISYNDIEKLAFELKRQTQDLLKHPYEPNHWHRRSVTLAEMRYPELALGDAYKCKILCRAHMERLRERSKWRLGHQMGFWMYDEERPKDDGDDEILLDRLRQIEHRALEMEMRCAKYWPEEGEGEGKFHRRPYPWMHRRHRKRSDELLSLMNQELAENPADFSNGKPLCCVKRHAFGEGDGQGYESTSEVLGVFALRDIQKGDVVMIDKTRVWGCNGPGSDGDYANLGGGRGCSNPIHPNLESEDVSLNMRWIRDTTGKDAAPVLRNCRLLLCCVEDSIEHPLDHPLIARMTPTYPRDRISTFSHKKDIMIPNKALQQFGIDIFANHNFDTWVLFTIYARAQNNSCSSPVMDSLNPLFSLFNHSCEPNVQWIVSADHHTIQVKTESDIAKGEQLFVEYDGYLHEKSLSERRKTMWKWLESPCQCTRCLREEAQVREVSAKADGLSEKSDWDIEEKPWFPEDALTLKN